jgi:hypothetical protein
LTLVTTGAAWATVLKHKAKKQAVEKKDLPRLVMISPRRVSYRPTLDYSRSNFAQLLFAVRERSYPYRIFVVLLRDCTEHN